MTKQYKEKFSRGKWYRKTKTYKKWREFTPLMYKRKRDLEKNTTIAIEKINRIEEKERIKEEDKKKKEEYILFKNSDHKKMIMQCYDEKEIYELEKAILEIAKEPTIMYSFRMPIRFLKKLSTFAGDNNKSIFTQSGFIRVAIKEKLERMKGKKYGVLKK